MKPYFEMEVVKVKKKKTYSNHIMIDGKKYILYEDEKENVYPHKEKGNWVNGENLDEIKFPCYGWYQSGIGKRYCELDFIQCKCFFRVKELRQHQCNKKKDYSYAEFWNTDLKRLIDMLDFHILKGKIILYEEK